MQASSRQFPSPFFSGQGIYTRILLTFTVRVVTHVIMTLRPEHSNPRWPPSETQVCHIFARKRRKSSHDTCISMFVSTRNLIL